LREEFKSLRETVHQQNVRITDHYTQIANLVSHAKAKDIEIEKLIENVSSHVDNEKGQNAKIANCQKALDQQETKLNNAVNQVTSLLAKTVDISAEHVNPTYVNTNSSIANARLRTVRRGMPESMVAFQAMKTDTQAVIPGDMVRFENVGLNLGNAYHPQHGLFVVPRNGIYVITATVLHEHHGTYLKLAIVHQGNRVAYLYGDDNEWEHSTQAVLIQANAGDEIWVRNEEHTAEKIYGNYYSTFAGYLLWEF